MRAIIIALMFSIAGCSSGQAHLADRAEIARIGAEYAVALEKCFNEAVAEYEGGIDIGPVNQHYEACARAADVKAGKK